MIYLRQINHFIGYILDGGAILCGNCQHLCASRLDFLHVADGFLQQAFLCCDGNHQCTILNQRNGALLEFPCGIGFTMDISFSFREDSIATA